VNFRTLGRTDLKVSAIGFGAWAIGGNAHGNSYGPTDDAESVRAVRRAVELGCNFFDTADVYGHGHSEELLGKALKDVRRDVVIATKVGGMTGDFGPEAVRSAVQGCLQRLQTDYIDVLQLHNPPIHLIAAPETYAVLDELQQAGTIRFYGVSVHPPEEGLAAVAADRPQTVQIVYNLVRREPEDEFFPAAERARMGVIAREPLGNGFLAGAYTRDSTWPAGDIRARMPPRYVGTMVELGAKVRELARASGLTASQLALKFVLDHPAVSTAIAGMKTTAHVEENLKAGD
jgi:aryl-alcohol dehydrogenase-like predicted oxidoreductase